MKKGILSVIFMCGVFGYSVVSVFGSDEKLYGEIFLAVPEAKVEYVNTKIQSATDFHCKNSLGEVENNITFICLVDLVDGKSGCGIQLLDVVSESEYQCELVAINNEVKIPLSFSIPDIFLVLVDEQLEEEQEEEREREREEVNVFPESFDISESFYKKSLQNKSLSCESSAASDILSTLERRIITEDDVIALLPKDKYNQGVDVIDGERFWGDPNKGFVGYIDKTNEGLSARQYAYEGYGVLEKPIAQVFNMFGYDTTIFTDLQYSLGYNQGEHMEDLLKSLTGGDYVQLWGDRCTDPEMDDGTLDAVTEYESNNGKSATNTCLVDFSDPRILEWNYLDENKSVKKHIGLSGEHAFILLGYLGGVQNPTDNIVWDTNTGRHIYPYVEWMRKWEKMQYRSVTIHAKKNL